MTLQGTVHLNRAILSLAASPSTRIICGTSGSIGGGGSKSDVHTREGDFRQYANGVVRLVLGATDTRVNSFTLRAITQAQYKVLRSMVGKTCLYRDTYGRRAWGSFLVTTRTDIPFSGVSGSTLLMDVSITFQTVTYVEGTYTLSANLPTGAVAYTGHGAPAANYAWSKGDYYLDVDTGNLYQNTG